MEIQPIGLIPSNHNLKVVLLRFKYCGLKTKRLKKDRVNVVTLGCSKNLVDSEVLVTQLSRNGLEVIHDSKDEDSNIVIINTCGFINRAKQESIDTILRFAGAKKNGTIEKLYVTGCLSERYQADLQKEIPEVDAYFGTHDLPMLLRKFNMDYQHELVGERKISTPSHYAYMKISEGCDRPCSFCAIPLMRGKHVSRPMPDLITEAKNLANNGVKELILIAQDSTYYGLDLYHKRTLSTLISRLSEIDGIEWIRLHYAFPAGFPMDIIDVMSGNPKICRYLDIPLQHASDRMLRIMKRGITLKKTRELIRAVREIIPDISIRTTLIAGHPGETEEDFETLVGFIEETRFDRLGVFMYSHEENTHSYTLEDDVPDAEKNKRAKQLMSVQEKISLGKNIIKIGNTIRVLIDRKEGGYFIGRTEFDSPDVDNEVLIKADHLSLKPGDFTKIQVTEAMPFDLIGVAVP